MMRQEVFDQRVLVGHHKHGGTPAVDLTEKVYNFKGEGRVDVAGGLVRHNHRGLFTSALSPHAGVRRQKALWGNALPRAAGRPG